MMEPIPLVGKPLIRFGAEDAEQLASILLGREVTLERNETKWRGEVVAVSEGPVLLIESHGSRLMIPIEGTTLRLEEEL